MKNLFFAFLSLLFFVGCSSPKTELHAVENLKGSALYGDSISDDNIIELASLQTLMKDETRKDIKIRGSVDQVCPKKGCWMIMKLEDGQEMRVTFKDYKIFVPTELAGKLVALDGFAYKDTVSVEDLRHYAEDAGKSAEEIAKIQAPEFQLAYEAKGLVVLD